MISRRRFISVSAACALAGTTAASLELPAHAGIAHGRTPTDIGPRPAVVDITRLTLKNTNYRTALWTNDDLQLTLMSIPVKGDVGLEVHPHVDQFFRIEAGEALVTMGTSERLDYVKRAGAGDAICIPSGTWHNIINVGCTPLKLYSLYGPQQHPLGTVHRTKPDEGPAPAIPVDGVTPIEPFSQDMGGQPYVFDIEEATVDNPWFRIAAWTEDDLQLTLMSIPVGGEVGLEMHGDVDQFLRVEEGRAKVFFGTSRRGVRFVANARPGDAILIPSGTWHNVVNASPRDELKLYSLYGPQQHPFGTIHRTAADAEH